MNYSLIMKFSLINSVCVDELSLLRDPKFVIPSFVER